MFKTPVDHTVWTPIKHAPPECELLVGWPGTYVDVAIFNPGTYRWVIRDTFVADHEKPELMPSHFMPFPEPDDERWRPITTAPSRQELLVGWANQPLFVDIAFAFQQQGSIIQPYESSRREWRYRHYQDAIKNGDHADRWMALPPIQQGD